MYLIFNRWILLPLLAMLPFFSAIQAQAQQANPPKRWNILWISAEDLSPDLGCYGDKYARSPAIDQLASQGARWTNAFSVAPVCAPSRSSIITGMFPTSIGSMHMRNQCVPPADVKCFPEYLRAAGYYCSNNVKTDYQFEPPATAWDDISNKAHWRNRRDKNQPFFAVFNFTTTHESQIRLEPEAFAKRTAALKPEERHKPEEARIPAYYPDTPIVRNDWARYHDLITAMDKQVADILQQLKDDGLADSTIVFFWGDHGRGLPRSKRWPYDSGTHVPMLVRWPGVIKPDTVVNDLVTLMDLGPSVLKVAGLKVPAHMQAKPFLGPDGITHDGRKYVFAHRDRMDETYDMIRTAREDRFRYVRNFQFRKPYAQFIAYMEEMPTMQEWRRLNKAGELKGPNALFFQPEKPKEELYDIAADPDEVNNLAADPRYRDVVKRMRKAVTDWMDEIKDLGFVPEPTLNEQFRPGGKKQKTAGVLARTEKTAEGQKITLACPTPGASIGWRKTGDPAKSWRLYTNPIEIKPGDTISIKACRIGFEDSPVMNFP